MNSYLILIMSLAMVGGILQYQCYVKGGPRLLRDLLIVTICRPPLLSSVSVVVKLVLFDPK